MGPPLPLVGASELIEVAFEALKQADAFIVLDDGRPVGVLARQDLLAHFAS
jgi:cystathionine beta-synthase